MLIDCFIARDPYVGVWVAWTTVESVVKPPEGGAGDHPRLRTNK